MSPRVPLTGPTAGVDGDIGWVVQQGVAGIERMTLAAGAERIGVGRCPVASALHADLQHIGGVGALSFGRSRIIFLNDSVAISSNPDKALVIDQSSHARRLTCRRHDRSPASFGIQAGYRNRQPPRL